MKEILLTIDGAVVADNKYIVLIKRAKEPFMDKLVLPGGHVNLEDQNTKTACVRELEEEIGLKINPKNLELLVVLDEIDRDPRPDRRISIAYRVNVLKKEIEKCKASSDAKEIIIREINSLQPEEMGFDHYLVIERLRKMIK